jgi:pilus assembly protein TadC
MFSIEKQALRIGFFLAIAWLGLMFFIKTSSIIFSSVLISCILSPLILKFFYIQYLEEKTLREKEKLMPDVLLHASSFPKGISTVEIIKHLSNTKFKLISNEFKRVEREIRKGASVSEALSNFKKRNKSRIISRAINLLIQGHESGAEMSEVFRETAQNILETQGIIRERNSALTIEKYTLLFAGGIIVPLILGLLTALIQGFDFNALKELSIGLSKQNRKELLSSAMLGNQVYIIEYAIIASIFVANMENNSRKALIYSLILLPPSIISYSVGLIL